MSAGKGSEWDGFIAERIIDLQSQVDLLKAQTKDHQDTLKAMVEHLLLEFMKEPATSDEIKQMAIEAGLWAIPGTQTGSSQQHNDGIIKLVKSILNKKMKFDQKKSSENSASF
jgi:hypothetical protein